MQIDVQSKSKSLLGVSDLTLVAPIRRGLIPALDSRSYETRLRLLLKTLSTLRMSSLEAEPTPLIADAIDRVRALHSFRLAIVGQEQKQLVLAVTFDGGWEPYMRRIWRDLGPLLDVIFCNCEGYLLAHDHSFAQYAAWVRSAQVDTEFFYNASSLTVNDLHYLRGKERQHTGLQRQPAAPGKTLFEQALPALSALYRLTDMYPPEHGLSDGDCLRRAALHLLKDVGEFLDTTQPSMQGCTATERAAVNWFAKAESRKFPEARKQTWGAGKLQGGIVVAYDGITHGCLLLVQLEDPAAAKAMLAFLNPRITRADAQTDRGAQPFINLGFTFRGLQVAGVPQGTLDQLPFEFREGMAARAGILGDFRYNHPSQWTLPERNWPEAGKVSDRVELSSVHAVVQYACTQLPSMQWKEWIRDANHPLAEAVKAFDAELRGKGVRILSVQSMQRFVKQPGDLPRDHFGFVDGISQPELPADADAVLGDLLLGHDNSHGDRPLTGRLWDDSTFLVIRKLKQDVAALKQVLRQKSALKMGDVKAQLVGRRVGGQNLIDHHQGNAFDYSNDPEGVLCPLQSHVRRANPRIGGEDAKRVPRILRRGMSYGPRDGEASTAERGVVFMAYNASIAEQFEVIQSWLSGGNSSLEHTYSAQRDPLLGVPQEKDPCIFTVRDRDGNEHPLNLNSQRPFVKLEWGAYVFVPSIKALSELRDLAVEAANLEAADRDDTDKKRQRETRVAVEAQKGAAAIARLQRAEQLLGFEAAREQWKIALEDVGARMSGVSQWIWTAVRLLHDGAMRTPYGVLVCSKKFVMQVFDNDARAYTATGYADRMDKSFGKIYLGMDDGPVYRHESAAANDAIQKVGTKDGFASAFEHTRSIVAAQLDALPADEERTLEVKDLVDEVLAAVSRDWFGLPDGSDVVAGGWHWKSDDPPTCPGHFHSPSRYMFQPNPGREATAVGQAHGKALRAAVAGFVHRHRGGPPAPPLAQPLFDAIADDDLLARTLIGVMMGFLPTVDGNLRGTLYEWVSDRSLWDHQIAYLADTGSDRLDKAQRVLLPALRRTLQLRPVPELVWRTALTRHSIGRVEVNPGDRIVVSIVSATQECRVNDDPDLYPIFGGDRSAATHPTHACPGYAMALGVMLGVLAGLLESARLRPTMSPMALRLSPRS